MKILLLGGTSDARALAHALAEAGHAVELHTLTDYGKSLGEKSDSRLIVVAGALDGEGLATCMDQADAVVDATHPHAQNISELAMATAKLTNVPLLRYERLLQKHPSPQVHTVASHSEAAALAVQFAGENGTVFLTIGSRNLESYTKETVAIGTKWIARVLPDADSLAACKRAGLTPGNIVALQGPTTTALDQAFLRHYGARVLVTKESGAAGGTSEKIAAALAEGVAVVVVARPTLNYPWATGDAATLLAEVATLEKKQLNFSLSKKNSSSQNEGELCQPKGCWHLYTGDGKGKTTAAVGLAVRAIGAGHRVCFVQFLKGGAESAELAALRKLGVKVLRPQQNPTGILRGEITEADHTQAQATMALAEQELCQGDWNVVILDEVHGAVRHGLVDELVLVEILKRRKVETEVVTTGRHATANLRAQADLVTEMRCERHYFTQGVPARRGVEF